MAEGEVRAELAELGSSSTVNANSANNAGTANKMDVPEDDPIPGRIKNGK
jgi:hypothetical protein